MTLGFLYWLLIILSLIFGFGGMFWPDRQWTRGWPVLVLVLFIILGWHVFGSPLRG